ncbi:LytT family response regulator AlgR [Erythrobacter litoralis]|jgi:two-component system response regulator AlgR|uniref:LytTR family transcriptional regulator n=1 Tax=Erythrobacter litoralis TaxID=39960 RepID=A0A074MUV0_9SPHN|nr:LytTR family DNA-binding domain-containing protein [Erythrobacter litoralis]AOL25043.1 LytT family response regulator AlgR [Erythrobacter litoralis]KEO96565.1 LytTR family transcriptional regulator [Erythrobacter litoralis]MEE4338827.1 LytTR family DNA-binding domain-containing protein [Erythrobacter sp.]
MSESDSENNALRTLIVDDEPLAVERIQVICAEISAIRVVGTASDGAAALRLAEKLTPDLVLLDMTMPELDGLGVARKFAESDSPPAVIFVTAHDHFAVEAFDLEAIDYVLKPVAADRLERAIDRAVARRAEQGGGRNRQASQWLEELWVPHRSELLRIDVEEVHRIDAERDYVRLHVGDPVEDGEASRSYLLLQTIAGLEARLDPDKFIRIHRSTILKRENIRGLRHDGLGVWSAELLSGEALRIGRTYLSKVKAMAGR